MSSNVEQSRYINIKFQEGAIDKVGINGCQVEDVIGILVDKLKAHQNGEFHTMENSIAINNLLCAQYALNCRKERIENKERR
ncbi:hypothetical protein [Bacillus sp. FJAT-47783]|uniref:hypothetical protein n=1 Tax=Bacillus sp. FJAT-47783 TaxID=2922712 RepID=UPI001FAE18E3|nr:hypothetical protein [Bacillus sp. FJAT-47783]